MALPEHESIESTTQHALDVMLLHSSAAELMAGQAGASMPDTLPPIAAAALLSTALQGGPGAAPLAHCTPQLAVWDPLPACVYWHLIAR